MYRTFIAVDDIYMPGFIYSMIYADFKTGCTGYGDEFLIRTVCRLMACLNAAPDRKNLYRIQPHGKMNTIDLS